MLTKEQCHYCQAYKAINLRGQSFLPDKKVIQYRLCQGCCNSMNGIRLDAMRQMKLNPQREGFWKTVFANASVKKQK